MVVEEEGGKESKNSLWSSGSSFLSRTEKNAVVIDISKSGLLAGFAGESTPRVTSKHRVLSKLLSAGSASGKDSKVTSQSSPVESQRDHARREEEDNCLDAALEVMHKVFFEQLHSKPKERRALVVVPDLTADVVVRSLASALLSFLEVPQVLVTSCSAVALFVTGAASGIVVDIDEEECKCSAVCEGSSMERSFTSCKIQGLSWEEMIQTDEIDEETCVAAAILESVKRCPVQVRPVLLQNIVLCGGVSSTVVSKVGTERVKMQLEAAILEVAEAVPRFRTLVGVLKQFLHVPSLAVDPALVSWVGGSVAASLDAFHRTAVTPEVFAKHPYAFNPSDLRWDTFQKEFRELDFAGESSTFRSIKQTSPQKTSTQSEGGLCAQEPGKEGDEEVEEDEDDPAKLVWKTFQPAPPRLV